MDLVGAWTSRRGGITIIMKKPGYAVIVLMMEKIDLTNGEIILRGKGYCIGIDFAGELIQ